MTGTTQNKKNKKHAKKKTKKNKELEVYPANESRYLITEDSTVSAPSGKTYRTLDS